MSKHIKLFGIGLLFSGHSVLVTAHELPQIDVNADVEWHNIVTLTKDLVDKKEKHNQAHSGVYINSYGLSRFCTDSSLKHTLSDASGFITASPSWAIKNSLDLNTQVKKSDWTSRSHYSSANSPSGYDGLESAYYAFMSNHSGTYNNNWLAPLSVEENGSCHIFSSQMSPGTVNLRHLFISGCCSVIKGECSSNKKKANILNNKFTSAVEQSSPVSLSVLQTPDKTWASRAKGVNCIYGVNGYQNDWGHYGSSFWNKWNRVGVQNKDAWFDAIDAGDKSALGGMICFGPDAREKLYSTELSLIKSTGSHWSYIVQEFSKRAAPIKNSNQYYTLYPYISLENKFDVTGLLTSSIVPAQAKIFSMPQERAVSLATSLIDKQLTSKKGIGWQVYQIKDERYSEAFGANDRLVAKRIAFSKKVGDAWIVTPDVMPAVKLNANDMAVSHAGLAFDINIPENTSWEISSKYKQSLLAQAEAKMIEKIKTENTIKNWQNYEIEVVSSEFGYDVRLQDSKGRIPLRIFGRVLLKEKSSMVTPKLQLISVGLK
ncbi:hypothetical protein J8L98_08430 [Pseudoalteromonas sp. MMG013]|uniref:hypothetical protein n=1 Tax=Pseudoalteromonas sp. MMG013 TaxID=2822687 RepID=UPI001B372789|nr:hypothetical protein [Pseudoalteromonas sp. MMG013]MBQ4861717.1 hypothetical protein [Pseudoalteromonas sp. MMG013]